MMTIICRFISTLCWVAIRSYGQIKQEADPTSCWWYSFSAVDVFCQPTHEVSSAETLCHQQTVHLHACGLDKCVCVYIYRHAYRQHFGQTNTSHHTSSRHFSTWLVAIHPWLSSLLPPQSLKSPVRRSSVWPQSASKQVRTDGKHFALTSHHCFLSNWISMRYFSCDWSFYCLPVSLSLSPPSCSGIHFK